MKRESSRRVFQKDVAHHWGISESLLSNLLKGSRGLGWQRCKAVSRKIGVDPAVLKEASPKKWRRFVEVAKRRQRASAVILRADTRIKRRIVRRRRANKK